VLTAQAEIACTLVTRLRGLLGRDGLPEGTLMYIIPCNSIHTLGMRFAIDLLFVDSGMDAVRVERNVSPGRVVFGGRRAKGVFEAASGWLPEWVACGTRVSLERAPGAM